MRIMIAKYKIAEKTGKPLGKLLIVSKDDLSGFYFYTVKVSPTVVNYFLVMPPLPEREKRLSIYAEKNEDSIVLYAKAPDDTVSLFHVLNHWVHVVTSYEKFQRDSTSHLAIKKRFITEENWSYIIDLHKNDEELRTVFGLMLDEEGNFIIDPMNEAAFTSAIGFVPCCHASWRSDQLVSLDFFKHFADMQIYYYYLSGLFKRPKFGISQYKYSNL